jgi:SET domain-containing protein
MYISVCIDQYGEFVSKPTWKSDVEPCTCAESKDKCEENCLNRAVYTECTRKCPNGTECRNQRISRREYAKTQVVLTESRGWGLIAKEDLPEGQLVIEYCGEMINDAECTRRLNETEITGKKDYYFFKLANDLVIDAGPIGNNARFLNHSCSPNCKTEMWQIGAQQRVGIFTLQTVPKGTELTYVRHRGETVGIHSVLGLYCCCFSYNVMDACFFSFRFGPLGLQF